MTEKSQAPEGGSGDERAQFEAAYVKAFPVTASVKTYLFDRDERAPDEYLEACPHVAWVMWQAALAAQRPCTDTACPCQDGDACHYKDAPDGTKAWPAPAEAHEAAAWLITGGRLYKEQVVLLEATADDRVATRADGSQKVPLFKAQPKGAEPAGWVEPELTPESMTDLAVAIGELSQAMGSPCVMGRAPQTLKSQTVRMAAFRLKEAQAPAPADELRERVEELENDVDRLTTERDEALRGPWQQWAENILKMVREVSGYDGYDDSEGVDVEDEVRELIAELTSQIKRLRASQAPAVAPVIPARKSVCRYPDCHCPNYDGNHCDPSDMASISVQSDEIETRFANLLNYAEKLREATGAESDGEGYAVRLIHGLKALRAKLSQQPEAKPPVQGKEQA